jgi:hypothetical protein
MGSGSFATRFTRANLGGHYLSAQSLGLTPLVRSLEIKDLALVFGHVFEE